MATFIWLGVLILIGFWVFMCLNIIKPNEMGIRVLLGKPADIGINSGLQWIWWPLQKLVRYTKEVMGFKTQVNSIMTKKGKVAGYSNIIETAEVNIICSVFYQFDIKKLNKTIQNAPGREAEALNRFLVPYTTDTVRALGGRVPWRVLNQERYYSALWVQTRLVGGKYCPLDDTDDSKPIKFDKDIKMEITENELKESPFIKFGLKSVMFTIEDVNFVNEDLQRAVSAPEKARLEADAKVLTAEAERKKIALEGMGSAEARGEMIAAIKENPDLEVLLTLREMAQGTSNTIFYQLPGGVEAKLREMLGGNDPRQILQGLGREGLEAVINAANQLLRRS